MTGTIATTGTPSFSIATIASVRCEIRPVRVAKIAQTFGTIGCGMGSFIGLR